MDGYKKTFTAIILLFFFTIVFDASAVDVWDRPVYQLNYSLDNLTNYYTISQIDYFFSQVYIELGNINNTIILVNNSVYSLYNFSVYLNDSINNLSYDVDNLYNITQDINDSILSPYGDYFLINSSGKYFIFNETKNNATIKDISKIYEYTHNMTVMAGSGQGYNISSAYIGFEIKEIQVIPSIINNKYRFQLEEYPSGQVIDRERVRHTGVWDIEKNYAINYSQVYANLTNVQADDNFSVIIKYLSNGVE